MTLPAVFVQDGARFTASDLAVGPWHPGALHGGATAALIVHALEEHWPAADLRLARLTCEFVRPVPRAALTVDVEVVRPGRRVTLLDAVVRGADGTEVTRARALLARRIAADVPSGDDSAPPFPGPESAAANDWTSPSGRMFATDAMEIRFVEGRFREPGPATAWLRLRHPLVAGRPVSPMEHLAAAADFGNGIASVLEWGRFTFINPDLTVYCQRPPVDDWVALRSRMRLQRDGVAIADSVLWDRRGRIGLATQSLLVERVD